MYERHGHRERSRVSDRDLRTLAEKGDGKSDEEEEEEEGVEEAEEGAEEEEEEEEGSRCRRRDTNLSRRCVLLADCVTIARRSLGWVRPSQSGLSINSSETQNPTHERSLGRSVVARNAAILVIVVFVSIVPAATAAAAVIAVALIIDVTLKICGSEVRTAKHRL